MHTRIVFDEITSSYFNVPGAEKMRETIEQFHYLEKMETQHICNISIPISSYLNILIFYTC